MPYWFLFLEVAGADPVKLCPWWLLSPPEEGWVGLGSLCEEEKDQGVLAEQVMQKWRSGLEDGGVKC